MNLALVDVEQSHGDGAGNEVSRFRFYAGTLGLLKPASRTKIRERANGESLVKEESADEHVVEQRKRICWTSSQPGRGGGKQTTS